MAGRDDEDYDEDEEEEDEEEENLSEPGEGGDEDEDMPDAEPVPEQTDVQYLRTAFRDLLRVDAEAAQPYPPDAISSDLEMPDLNCVDLADSSDEEAEGRPDDRLPRSKFLAVVRPTVMGRTWAQVRGRRVRTDPQRFLWHKDMHDFMDLVDDSGDEGDDEEPSEAQRAFSEKARGFRAATTKTFKDTAYMAKAICAVRPNRTEFFSDYRKISDFSDSKKSRAVNKAFVTAVTPITKARTNRP